MGQASGPSGVIDVDVGCTISAEDVQEDTEINFVDRDVMVEDVASSKNLFGAGFDHSPIYLEPTICNNFAPTRRFCFENTWLKEPLCIEIVKDCWKNGQATSFDEKLSLCVEKLKEWGKEITGTLNHRIKKYTKELKVLHGKRDVASVQCYNEVKKKLFKALDQRESYWKQRAKQFWLHEGDQNSSYFHKAASSKKKNNQIEQLKDDHDNWVTWESGLSKVVAECFHGLFASGNTCCTEVIDCVSKVVSDSVNMELCQPIGEEDVKKALFQMNPDKSLGPDGMTPAFYQRCWSIVRHDVVKCVRYFFDQCTLEDGNSEANVVLIPKKKNPELMSDPPPIALCNVMYKIITKVMFNRMKLIINTVISENQSVFIPGRLISDNVLVSFEIRIT
uniref:Reverse transcriptase n=1 Tax=Cannabis sativa TaxID=3483 RepID=A0A803Q7A9_CANSA